MDLHKVIESCIHYLNPEMQNMQGFMGASPTIPTATDLTNPTPLTPVSPEKDPTVKKPKRHRTPNSARGALFICALCPESFSKFSALDNHYQTIHDGIPCHVCRIIIKNRILLDKHMTTCHREEDRNVCLVCMKQMASKATLRKHIVMHEDRRPYECAVCKRSFRYSYDMRLHMRRTHRGILGEGSEEPTTPGKKSPGRPKQEKANS